MSGWGAGPVAPTAGGFAMAIAGGASRSYLQGDVDPTAGAGVTAPVGSLYLFDNAGVGELCFKFGAGDTEWYCLVAPPPPPGPALTDTFDRTVAPTHGAGWGDPSGVTCDASPITWGLKDNSPDVDHVADATDFDRVSTQGVAPSSGSAVIELTEYPALAIGGHVPQRTGTTETQIGAGFASIPCTIANKTTLGITLESSEMVNFPAVAPDANNGWYVKMQVSFEGDAGGGSSITFEHDFDQISGDTYKITLVDDDADTSHHDGIPWAGPQAITFDRDTARGTTIITCDALGEITLPLPYFDPGFPEDQPYNVIVRLEAGYGIRDATEIDPDVNYEATFTLDASGFSCSHAP